MRLARALVNGSPKVLVERNGSYALAMASGREFSDLPELLAAERIEAGETVEPGDFLPVVGRPGKIICIGLNYRAHAEETGRPPPDYPMLFPKWHTSLAGPFADIPLPPESDRVDWEAELAFVFGKPARRVRAEDAGDYVFGYTAANDVSMRDFQRHTAQFTAGKAWDHATPLGPVVVTADELGGTAPDLAITGRLDGETMQDSRTDDLIFGVPELVEYITTAMTMEPGDLVLTGTPSGVGNAMDPPRYLTDGAVYEVEIEGIGTLHNTFRAESL